MNTRLRFRSVKTRQAFWFLVVAMVPVCTVVVILYFQRAEVIRGREFEKLQTVRDLKVIRSIRKAIKADEASWRRRSSLAEGQYMVADAPRNSPVRGNVKNHTEANNRRKRNDQAKT